MPKKKLSNLFIFRRRVPLSYGFIFIALAALIAVALLIPGGLTESERDSAVTAVHSATVAVNAPYYLLQHASIKVIGLSTLGIKLPSVGLGLVLGVSLFLLLRRWLTLSIAVFSALIIFTGTTFLSLSGTGSPLILYVLYPALLLFFGTRVLAHDRGLIVISVLLLLTIALALLTPSMIYLVVLAIGIAVLNPHVRYGFRRLPIAGLVALGVGFLLALVPLVYVILSNPASLTQILAIPNSVSFTGIGSNIDTLLALYARFLHPGFAMGMIAPLIGLATAGLGLLGLYRIIRAIYTARAQFIIGWSVIAALLAIFDPNYGILLYLPVVLLASIGLSQLASIWYRTFPLNPYARVFALVPIGVLIAGIVIGSSIRYVNTTLYAKGSAELYSHDLQVLQNYLAHTKQSGFTLSVPAKEVAFYTLLHSPAVAAVISTGSGDDSGPMISTSPVPSKTPVRILTDGRSNHADRFYVYQ